MALGDPASPHQFEPDPMDTSVCALCGNDPDDPVHDVAGMARTAEDQLELGRFLLVRARLTDADRADLDTLAAFMASGPEGAVERAAKNPPNLAPYKIVTRDGQIVVVNNAGEVKAKFGQDRAAALKYLRALYVNVAGAPGKAANKKWSGKQKRAS